MNERDAVDHGEPDRPDEARPQLRRAIAPLLGLLGSYRSRRGRHDGLDHQPPGAYHEIGPIPWPGT